MMRSQAPEAVEKAGLLAETRRMGHPEHLFVSTLTPEKSRRWHDLTFSRYSLVHTNSMCLILKLTFLNYYTTYVYNTKSRFQLTLHCIILRNIISCKCS